MREEDGGPPYTDRPDMATCKWCGTWWPLKDIIKSACPECREEEEEAEE